MVLHSFSGGGSYGGGPTAGLVAKGDMLYGTTTAGGAYDRGTAFSMNAAGYEDVLHSFGAGSDGAEPTASPVFVRGELYGTTANGGLNGDGTVYSVRITTGKERVLHSFGGSYDGGDPQAGLIAVNGTLYGTTAGGGAYGGGTVFSIGTGGGNEHVLHSFGSGSDGAQPLAGLLAVGKWLYGTTAGGGAYARGSVFGLLTTGGSEHLLYSFKGGPDGQNPQAALIALKRMLYGTTTRGGNFGGTGTIFRIGVATGKESVLHSFGSGSDGQFPQAPLLDANNTLYGTTVLGGSNFGFCYTSGGTTLGTVYSLSL